MLTSYSRSSSNIFERIPQRDDLVFLLTYPNVSQRGRWKIGCDLSIPRRALGRERFCFSSCSPSDAFEEILRETIILFMLCLCLLFDNEGDSWELKTEVTRLEIIFPITRKPIIQRRDLKKCSFSKEKLLTKQHLIYLPDMPDIYNTFLLFCFTVSSWNNDVFIT